MGRRQGTADKAAILFARPGCASLISSLPTRWLGTVPLVSVPHLAVLSACAPTPRLASAAGLQFLRERCGGGGGGGDGAWSAEAAHRWANATLASNGPAAYVAAVDALVPALADPARVAAAGLTGAEAALLLAALRQSAGPPLLREWCAGGALERLLGADAPPRARHVLVLRALRLVPRDAVVGGVALHPRKAALYGLSEQERCQRYVGVCQAALAAPGRTDEDALSRLLALVRAAHDGDRAVVDYATGGATAWAASEHSAPDEGVLERWAAEGRDLATLCGGFERSLPELDAMAEALQRRFGGRVQLRVAGAGLGGAVCLHAHADCVPDVQRVLEAHGWRVRQLRPGAPACVVPTA